MVQQFERIYLFYLKAAILVGAMFLVLPVPIINGQQIDRISRGRAKDMLNNVKNQIKGDYYDATYRGIDLEAHFKKAETKLDEATSMNQAFGIIAQAVIDFNDSHTRFYPPSQTVSAEYGWRMQMIGDKCYVTAVKPGSDAEKQGLKAGDQIIKFEGFAPTRKELWKAEYYYNAISPRSGLTMQVQSPDRSEIRTMQVASKITRAKAVLSLEDLIREIEISDGRGARHRFLRLGNVQIWKMPSFLIAPADIDGIMADRVGRSGSLILDLRGNGGGYVVTLEKLAGYFVEQDTKIADLKGRKPMKPQTAKTAGTKAFTGKLIVLLDSRSGSASEIFARFMQLQGRAVVIGDVSAGAVMQSRSVPMQMGVETIIPFGMNLTHADVIMADGASIEHRGVEPQIFSIPTGADMAAGRDPVLAAALSLLGQAITPEAAGKLLPLDGIRTSSATACLSSSTVR